MKLNWRDILKKIAISFFVLCSLAIVIANFIINQNGKTKVFTDVTKIPKNKVGLLLGTSKILEDGTKNLHYNYRVDAAETLYKAGKVDVILISSSYESKYNDNPKDFKKALIERGIPEQKLFLDYNGIRTLSSVVSLHQVYQVKNVTFISQKFHNERAIYLAEHFGINAIGFNAQDVTNVLGFKTQTREYFARVKVFLDFFFGLKPDFLNSKIIQLN